MNKQQLQLTAQQLISIGFTEHNYPADELNVAKQTFEIDCLNSRFIFNVNTPVYVWYYQTIIGEVSNYILLDITQVPTLYAILSAFNVKYNLVII